MWTRGLCQPSNLCASRTVSVACFRIAGLHHRCVFMVWVRACVPAYTHVHMHVCVCVYTYIHTYIHAYVHTYIDCVYVYIYMYIVHTHTHTHTGSTTRCDCARSRIQSSSPCTFLIRLSKCWQQVYCYFIIVLNNKLLLLLLSLLLCMCIYIVCVWIAHVLMGSWSKAATNRPKP